MKRPQIYDLRFTIFAVLAVAGVVANGHTVITVNPGGGADQTSLSAALAAVPNPMTGDYEIAGSGATNDTTPATINVNTNGYNLYVHGNNTTGIFDDSKYQMVMGAYQTAITITTPAANVIVEGIQFAGIATSYAGVFVSTATGSIIIRNCLFQDFTQVAGGMGIYFYGTGDTYTGRMAYNNIAWNCAMAYVVWQCQGTFYNNTASASTQYGLYVTKASCNAVLKNNLITGSTTADYYVNENGAGTIVTAKNFTGDGTGTDPNQTITFVGGEDFHLDASMNRTMKGVDLSTAFTTDIDAEPRSWWDPGADEKSTPQKLMTIRAGGARIINQRRQQ